MRERETEKEGEGASDQKGSMYLREEGGGSMEEEQMPKCHGTLVPCFLRERETGRGERWGIGPQGVNSLSREKGKERAEERGPEGVDT